MLLRVKDIVRMTGGRLIGDPDVLIDGAAPVDEAGPTDVAFVAERSYAAAAKLTEAGCVIVTDDLEGHIWSEKGNASRPPAVIVAADARLSFAKVLETLKPLPLHPRGIHPTAIVADDARLGVDVAVGPYAVIESGAVLGDGVVVGNGALVSVDVHLGHRVVVGASSIVGEATRIGDDTVIHPRVTVMDRVTIGCGVILHPGCVIGADGFGYVSSADGHHKVPHIGTVVIKDDVEVGANSTIDRATTGQTFIGRGTKIDNHVMIAHNVHIGEYCLVVAMTGISGGTTAGDRVIFAGKSGVVGHVHIGSDSVVAAAAIVAGDVPEGSHVSGFPARPHRQHMRVLAATQKLPEQLREMAQLKKQVAELQRQLNEMALKTGSGDDR